MDSLTSYSELVATVGRTPDAAEYLAWSFLGIEPEWYIKLVEGL